MVKSMRFQDLPLIDQAWLLEVLYKLKEFSTYCSAFNHRINNYIVLVVDNLMEEK